jgi:hypothetical protein
LAHLLSTPRSDADLISLRGERLCFYDLIQRIYTDDGSGNGRMTLEGVRMFTSHNYSVMTSASESILFKAVEPAALFAVSREELLGEYDKLMDLQESKLNRPPREIDSAEVFDSIKHSGVSLLTSLRFGLIADYIPVFNHVQWTAERFLGHRDGVLVGLALEAYRRGHGAYPKSLEELTPLLLPEVPADRITGEPVRYRIVDGQPIVYSVGVDRKDDGGRVPYVGKHRRFYEAAQWNPPKDKPLPDGDWLLYPQSKFSDDDD